MDLRVVLWLLCCGWSAPLAARVVTPLPLERGFIQIPMVTPENLAQWSLPALEQATAITRLCAAIKGKFQQFRWQMDPCGSVAWRAEFQSTAGWPLLYTVFGTGERATLFLGGVHPDEITPIHLAFRFAQYLHEHPAAYEQQGLRVIVAPLVNPDGFLRKFLQRTNGRVDINRNFLTRDWYEQAGKAWRRRRSGGARYFPGYFPNTEIETFFQIKLIDLYAPDKIFSVHAPLGFLDYDGPGDQQPVEQPDGKHRAKQFVYAVSKKTDNYRVVDYSFYPGSLGNYAGNERNLPTITLELATTAPERVEEYWQKFLPGFLQSIEYPFERVEAAVGAAPFFSIYQRWRQPPPVSPVQAPPPLR